MRLKKNTNKDLNLKRGLYFVIGLLLTLLLIYIVLEWKTTTDTNGYEIGILPNKESREHLSPIVLTTQTKTSTSLAPTDSIRKTDEFIEITNCGFDSDKELLGCYMIEEPPIFPGCEDTSDQQDCFQKMMQEHAKKNFHYPESEYELGIQGRVYTMFEIEKDGSIGNIRMRGPNKNFENEAQRIINKLPQMTPANHQEKSIKVVCSLPITFKL